jgi:hypothetical protein
MDNLAKHPVTWILVGLLALATYGNYKNGRRLTKICDLVSEPFEWLAEMDRLEAENSLRRDVSRWQQGPGQEIQNTCAER